MNTIEKTDKYVFNTYSRVQKVFVKGKDATLWDEDGNRYTDFLAGIAVCSLGHCNPAVTEAVCNQAKELIHVSNLFYTVPQAELAKLLVEKSFADRVFFANSGAEANEAAIKLARRYFHVKGRKERFKIITMKQSFHGRTMATLSATGQEKIRKGFDPIVDGFIYTPFNDIDALKENINNSVCAIMLEPVQGEGGVIPADPDYLKSVRKLCNDNDILLIFDEVQSGMGRCGRLFAHEIYNVKPDIMTLAKALGNGLPIGAMLATENAAKGFSLGSHATTFGGTPLVTSAAIEVLKIVSDPEFLKDCREKGAYLRERLGSLRERHGSIKEIRGKGLLVGMEIKEDAGKIVSKCMDKGFVLNAIQDKILRFAPPLVIKREEIDGLIDALDKVLP